MNLHILSQFWSLQRPRIKWEFCIKPHVPSSHHLFMDRSVHKELETSSCHKLAMNWSSANSTDYGKLKLTNGGFKKNYLILGVTNVFGSQWIWISSLEFRYLHVSTISRGANWSLNDFIDLLIELYNYTWPTLDYSVSAVTCKSNVSLYTPINNNNLPKKKRQ